MVSILMRLIVSPEVRDFSSEKTMEIRFFAPGSLVSNLDFVETIFGNAGDPTLSENNSALDTEHWTGHTGCVILAPQMLHLKKKEIKTQISYSANLYGNVEEEHSGGAIAYARNNMMDRVYGNVFSLKLKKEYKFKDSIKLLADRVEVFAEGYAIDKKYPNVIYIHENANLDINKFNVSWTFGKNKQHQIKLTPTNTYSHPSGHKFNLLNIQNNLYGE